MNSIRYRIGPLLVLSFLLLGLPISLDAADSDLDGVESAADNCPSLSNADQADRDGDQQGDLCDLDIDGDGLVNAYEEEILETDPEDWDSDADTVSDFYDCGPLDPQVGLGAECDEIVHVQPPLPPSGSGSVDPFGDEDGDGVTNENDNCPFVFNPGQQDADGDGVGDACDPETQLTSPPEERELLDGIIDGEKAGCSLLKTSVESPPSAGLGLLLLASLALIRLGRRRGRPLFQKSSSPLVTISLDRATCTSPNRRGARGFPSR